jgi:hypothetical protein
LCLTAVLAQGSTRNSFAQELKPLFIPCLTCVKHELPINGSPLSLPRLAPGKVQFLRTRAHAIKPVPLGSPDRVPPRKLLTAFGLAGDSPRKRSLPSKENAVQQPQVGTLPPDLMAMLLQETPHWIGNINVLVRAADVERHVAKELRVYPGRLNLAWFFVGHGGHESYCFRLEGLGKEWQADLFVAAPMPAGWDLPRLPSTAR